MSEDRIEAQRDIAAPPQKIFSLLCDPAGHVTIDASGMLQSAEGARITAAGDTFVVHMDREAKGDMPWGKYDVTVTITDFEPDQVLEWTVGGNVDPPVGHVYGFRLESSAVGTHVTHYCDWSKSPARYRDIGLFPVVDSSGLRATLGILARTVE